MNNEKINQVKQEMNFSALIQKEAINQEDMSISFLALSNNPTIKRNGFFEDYYISIDTDNVKFNAQNLYLDHNRSFNNSVGVITESKKDSEGFKVKVKFFANIPASKEAFERYQAGLSKSVSVGFGEVDVEEVGKIDGLIHYKITSGEIMELSAVWKGADDRAIVSKYSKETQEKPSDEVFNLNKGKQVEKEKQLQEFNQNSKEDSVLNYSNEAKEIAQLAEIIGDKDAGIRAISQGIDFKTFRENILAKKTSESKNFNILPSNKKVDESFSISNILRGNIGIEADFKQSNGRFRIPDSFYSNFEEKAYDNAGTDTIKSSNESIKSIEPITYRGDRFINLIKKQSPILKMLDFMPDLNGEQQIPRDDTELDAYFIEEGQTTKGQSIAFSDIKLRPHTISAKVKITRNMHYMTPEVLDSFILRKMIEAYKTRVEKTLFYGKTPTPITGIFNTTGVNVVDSFLKAPTYKRALEFKAKLWSKDYDVNRCVFVVNSNSFVDLEGTARTISTDKVNLTDRTLIESGKLAGFNVIMNNLIKDKDIVLADFSNIIMGTWVNGLEIKHYEIEGGITIVEGFYDFDFAIKRTDSIVISQVPATVVS